MFAHNGTESRTRKPAAVSTATPEVTDGTKLIVLSAAHGVPKDTDCAITGLKGYSGLEGYSDVLRT
jgi:hypothetical protein